MNSREINAGLKVVTVPNINLTGIDPEKVRSSLLKGKYTKPSFISIIKKASSVDIAKNNEVSITSDSKGDKITHLCANGENYLTATDNCAAFNSEKGGRCYYCRTEYKGERHGLPLYKEVVDGIILWYTHKNNLCSPECTNAYINYINLPLCERNELHSLAREMHYDMYGVWDIPSANDFELLRCNGGSLSYQEWDVKNGNVYTRVKGSLIVPCKTEFVKKNKR